MNITWAKSKKSKVKKHHIPHNIASVGGDKVGGQ